MFRVYARILPSFLQEYPRALHSSSGLEKKKSETQGVLTTYSCTFNIIKISKSVCLVTHRASLEKKWRQRVRVLLSSFV